MKHLQTKESKLLAQVDSKKSIVILSLIASKILDTKLIWWQEATWQHHQETACVWELDFAKNVSCCIVGRAEWSGVEMQAAR